MSVGHRSGLRAWLEYYYSSHGAEHDGTGRVPPRGTHKSVPKPLGESSFGMGVTDFRQGEIARTAAPVRVVPRVKEARSVDALRLSLAALMVIEISRVHGEFPILAAARPLLVLTAIALAAAFVNPGGLAKYKWMSNWQARVLLAMCVTALGSIAFGISQGGSFFFFQDSYSKTLLGAFLLMAAMRNARDLRFFVWAYVVGTAILVWLAMFVFEMSNAGGVTRLSGLDTWDANDLGVLLLTGLPLCGLTFRTSKTAGKLFSAIVLLGIGSSIARSGSRGGFIGFLCVLFAYLVSLRGTKVANRVGIVVVIVAGLAWAAPEGYWEQMQTIIHPEADYNWDALQGRRQLAIRGMQYMTSHPLFGIGIDNFGRAEATISEFAIAAADDPNAPGIKWSVAHNSYVQVGAEMGIPGFVLFIGLVVGCIVSPWYLRRLIPDSWARGTPDEQFMFQASVYLPIAGLGFGVPAYFVSFSYADPIYILTAMTAALSAAVHAHVRQLEQEKGLTAHPDAVPVPARPVFPMPDRRRRRINPPRAR